MHGLRLLTLIIGLVFCSLLLQGCKQEEQAQALDLSEPRFVLHVDNILSWDELPYGFVFALTPEAADLYAALTEKYRGEKFEIYIDDMLVRDETLRAAVKGSSVMIYVDNEYEHKIIRDALPAKADLPGTPAGACGVPS